MLASDTVGILINAIPAVTVHAALVMPNTDKVAVMEATKDGAESKVTNLARKRGFVMHLVISIKQRHDISKYKSGKDQDQPCTKGGFVGDTNLRKYTHFIGGSRTQQIPIVVAVTNTTPVGQLQ